MIFKCTNITIEQFDIVTRIYKDMPYSVKYTLLRDILIVFTNDYTKLYADEIYFRY